MEQLILCNADDPLAISVHQLLTNNKKRVDLVTAEELMYARSWVHEINHQGEVNTEIVLQNGKVIRSDQLKASWNRIRFFSMLHFKNETDRFYAQNEMYALFVSSLNNINKTLINPICIHDLAMENENLLYLKHQATKAGLKVLDFHFTSSPRWKTSKNLIPFSYDKKEATAFRRKALHGIWQNQPSLLIERSGDVNKLWIVDGKITNTNIVAEEKAFKKLSTLLNKIFLEVDFVKTKDGMKVSNINTFPLNAPDGTVAALAQLLLQKTKQGI